MEVEAEHPGADEVRRQVRQILDSATFRNAGRLSRFLEYITTQALNGASEAIKEYAVGVEVFQRGPGFDPRSDSVVRVEARRLRTKLRDYYESEGVADAVRITMPKGSYVPVFRCRESAARVSRPWVRRWAIGALVVIALLLVFWQWPRIARTTGVRKVVVAILPLENLSTDPTNDYFCHGMADESAARLQRVSQVRVITRGPGGPLAARAELASVVRDQKAGYALEGSASFAAGRVHVTMVLVDLSTFTNVWQESYARSTDNLLGVQSELAHAVADAVGPFLR